MNTTKTGAIAETINKSLDKELIIHGKAAFDIGPVVRYTTGIPSLDIVTGGIPRGRIIHISGGEDSGKTTLALQIAQFQDGPVLFMDAENKLTPYLVKDGRNLFTMYPDTLESALSICKDAAKAFRVIVVDTITALPTRADLEAGVANCTQNRTAAEVLSRALPILAGRMKENGCTLILVNQLRNTGAMFGRPDKPTGGRALGYYSALWLNLNRVEVTKDYQKVVISVRKNKYGRPFGKAVCILCYGEGIAEYV